MWTAVYIAQNRKIADRIERLLTEEGMLVKIQPISKKMEDRDGYFEILVPEGEAQEAQNILYETSY